MMGSQDLVKLRNNKTRICGVGRECSGSNCKVTRGNWQGGKAVDLDQRWGREREREGERDETRLS